MFKVLSVILGVLLAVGGVYCLLAPGVTFLILGYVIGLCMIIDGIGTIIGWFRLRQDSRVSGWLLASSIISLLFGIMLVGSDMLQLAVDMFIVYAAAIWIAVIGVLRIFTSFKIKKGSGEQDGANSGKLWWVELILGILLFILGILCFIMPLVLMQTIGIFIGISIIVSGIDMIYLGTSSVTA